MDWSLPLLKPERQVDGNQSWKTRGIFHQTMSNLPVANQVFLGSWTVDIRQEVHSRRSAPQRTQGKLEMALLRCTQETE